MPLVALTGVGLIVATTLLHYETLSLLTRLLERLRWHGRAKLVVALLGCFVGHGSEILLYGLGYWLLITSAGHGTLGGSVQPDLASALYFSAETYTSLGFGDVVPSGAVRLLAGVETLNGLLLIGWSGSFLYLEMERYWKRSRGPGR
ncbi:MAG TPA: potassium channel family protein [Methylibium sp.]|nr:potassium channel family protein [Methylibium sp.]